MVAATRPTSTARRAVDAVFVAALERLAPDAAPHGRALIDWRRVPSFCRHNRFVPNCPICRERGRSRRRAAAKRPRPASAGRGAARSGARSARGAMRVRQLARAADDGYRSDLVPGLTATADAGAARRRAGVRGGAPRGVRATTRRAARDAAASRPRGRRGGALAAPRSRLIGPLEDVAGARPLRSRRAWSGRQPIQRPVRRDRGCRVPWAVRAARRRGGRPRPAGARTRRDGARLPRLGGARRRPARGAGGRGGMDRRAALRARLRAPVAAGLRACRALRAALLASVGRVDARADPAALPRRRATTLARPSASSGSATRRCSSGARASSPRRRAADRGARPGALQLGARRAGDPAAGRITGGVDVVPDADAQAVVLDALGLHPANPAPDLTD